MNREEFLDKLSDLLDKYDKTLQGDDDQLKTSIFASYAELSESILETFFEWIFDNYE